MLSDTLRFSQATHFTRKRVARRLSRISIWLDCHRKAQLFSVLFLPKATLISTKFTTIQPIFKSAPSGLHRNFFRRNREFSYEIKQESPRDNEEMS